MTDQRVVELVKECARQEESCLYTSTSLYIWQKRARGWRNVFVIAPIILGGIASSQIVGGADYVGLTIFAAICSLLAGFFPAIFEALGMDMRVQEIGQAASEYTNLRDRFRQVARIKSLNTFEEFEAAFEQLMDRMDAIRGTSPPVPEWCFAEAQAKIGKGDMNFNVDQSSE